MDVGVCTLSYQTVHPQKKAKHEKGQNQPVFNPFYPLKRRLQGAFARL
jgi:hypothetical protein